MLKKNLVSHFSCEISKHGTLFCFIFTIRAHRWIYKGIIWALAEMFNR